MSRLDDVTRAFLRFLYTNPRFRPTIADFSQGTDATVGGIPVTPAEIEQVLARLRGHDLVAASSTLEGGLPERVGLSGAGLICAGDYDGDVRAWQERARVRVPRTIGDPRGPDPPVVRPIPPPVLVPANLPDPPTAGLARVSRVLLLTLPSVQPDQEQCETLRKPAEQLLATIRAGGPAEHIRAHATLLRAELVNGPVAETLGVVLLDGLDEAIAEWEGPRIEFTHVPVPPNPTHAPARPLNRTTESPRRPAG